MKKELLWGTAFLFCILNANAQLADSAKVKKWDLNAEAYLYFFSDDFITLPTLKADRAALHLEARYNYENYNAVSTWVGFNFSGGKKLEYTITPMAGLVMGSTSGLAPGLECSLTYRNLEWYSEMEHVFDLNSTADNFFYMWSDLSYSLRDRFWLGLSAQRTRLYETDLDIQRGIFVGGAFKNWEFQAYLYNLYFDEPFVILSLAFNY